MEAVNRKKKMVAFNQQVNKKNEVIFINIWNWAYRRQQLPHVDPILYFASVAKYRENPDSH